MRILSKLTWLLIMLFSFALTRGATNTSDHFLTETTALIPFTTEFTDGFLSTKVEMQRTRRPPVDIGWPWNNKPTGRPNTKRGPPRKPGHILYDISEMTFKVASPVITIAGFLCNILVVIIVARSRSLKRSPVSMFMIALACADSCVLLLDFVTKWIRSVFGISLLHQVWWFCKGYNFLFVIAHTTAAWLVCAMALQRCFVVCFPLKGKRFCTVKISKIVAAVVPIAVSLANIHFLFMYELEGGMCRLQTDFENFHLNYGRWQVYTMYSWLPITTLIFCSAIIMLTIARRNHELPEMGTEKLGALHVTKTVLVVCITYATMTLPLTITLAIGAKTQQLFSPVFGMVRTSVLILGICNHAINFLIYNLTLPRFNKDTRRLFCCQRGRPNQGQKPKAQSKDRSLVSDSKDASELNISTSVTGVE